MKNIIQFKEANCKNCYKCIRNCPVKSIQFENDQARIIHDECVLCGHCFLVCPQNAKYIQSSLEEVKGYIKSGAKVYASLAPSYLAAFPGANFATISDALKKLGFVRVEETAIGAAKVSEQYARLLDEGKMDNIMTTCCPTTILLIEKYYPELVKYLAPVVSPAMAHAKLLKNIYGSKIKVVFIGPCISKKYEARQNKNINATLMFDELADWLAEEGISLTAPDPEPAEMHAALHRLYPIPGGIIRTIPTQSRRRYKCVAVDGLDRCMEILDSIKNDGIKGYFLELSACKGSCAEGPGVKSFNTAFLKARDSIVREAMKKTETPMPLTESVEEDLSTVYNSNPMIRKVPDESTIKAILASIGKTTPDTMLNCSTCGYPTCYDKAIAVYQGKADVRMCLPYMRERAESMSNLVMDHTPNGIFLLDNELNIVEYNQAASVMFDLSDRNYEGLPIGMLMEDVEIDRARQTGQSLLNQVYHPKEGDRWLEYNVIPVVDKGTYLITVSDVTMERQQQDQLRQMRTDTIETAQKVIDKQMRVAQEIASLLGETTGETKTALTRLKRSMAQEDQK